MYGLQSFVDGTVASPSKLFKKIVELMNKDTGETNYSEVLKENPGFEEWDKRYSTVTIWIYSSLSPSYLKHLVNLHTANEYCISLQKAFTYDSICGGMHQ